MTTVQAGSVDPTNPHNGTSAHPNEIGWSIRTPGAILGRLDPPRAWATRNRVPNLMDPATGRAVLDSNGEVIPDYPFLPRYLSSNVEWFRIEAYFRAHKDMSYYAIWQRQPRGTPMPTSKQRNSMNNMRLRKARRPYNARCWTKKANYPPKILVELVEGLSQTQLLLNTTWIVTPHAIQQPGTNRLLPLDMYLDGAQVHTPSSEVRAALAESHRLQALAKSHNFSHWSELPKHLLPNAWFGRTRAKQSQRGQRANNNDDESSKCENFSQKTEVNESGESGENGKLWNIVDVGSEIELLGEDNLEGEEEGGEEEDLSDEGKMIQNKGTSEDGDLLDRQDGMSIDEDEDKGNATVWVDEGYEGYGAYEVDMSAEGGARVNYTADNRAVQGNIDLDIYGFEGADRMNYNQHPSVRRSKELCGACSADRSVE